MKAHKLVKYLEETFEPEHTPEHPIAVLDECLNEILLSVVEDLLEESVPKKLKFIKKLGVSTGFIKHVLDSWDEPVEDWQGNQAKPDDCGEPFDEDVLPEVDETSSNECGHCTCEKEEDCGTA